MPHNTQIIFFLGGKCFSFLFECPSVASKSTDSHTERGPFCSTCKQRVRHTRTHTRTEIEILNSKIGHPVRYDELFTLILEKYYSYEEIRWKSGGSGQEVAAFWRKILRQGQKFWWCHSNRGITRKHNHTFWN